ncbi:MAG: hypothetical protein ACYC3G_00140 [Minisyncoccota bacterium]
MILKYQKNIISALLTLTILASFNIYFYPTKVGAVAGIADVTTVNVNSVSDPVTVASSKANVTTAVSQKASFGQTLLEWSKKMLGIVLKRAILDRIVDQTVAWIQNDFQGKPPFMENPEAFKKQVVDNAVGAAIQSIAPGLCSPFSVQLQIGLVGPAKLSQQFSCTLSDVTANIDNFTEEFSKKGGKRWLQYAAIWEPQNNIWGATFMAQDLKDKTAAQVVKEQDLSQTINLGFTATEACTPVAINKTVSCQEGTPNCTCQYVTNPPTCTKVVSTKCTQGMEGCQCKIKTPGNFIASEVFGIASSGTEKSAILSADDVATYVGTLMDAIISHYTQLGMKGLMGVLYPEAGDKKSEWDVTVRKAFSSLDAMTYSNTKKMYLDEIDSVLAVKNSSLTSVNALIDKENELNKLAVISVCTLPGAAEAQPFVSSILTGAESSLNYLNDLKDSIENNIADMNSVKIEMQNSVYPENPSDSSGQAEQYASLSLLAGYQDLKDRKILDIDAANKESESIARNGEIINLNVTTNLTKYGALADSCIASILANPQ